MPRCFTVKKTNEKRNKDKVAAVKDSYSSEYTPSSPTEGEIAPNTLIGPLMTEDGMQKDFLGDWGNAKYSDEKIFSSLTPVAVFYHTKDSNFPPTPSPSPEKLTDEEDEIEIGPKLGNTPLIEHKKTRRFDLTRLRNISYSEPYPPLGIIFPRVEEDISTAHAILDLSASAHHLKEDDEKVKIFNHDEKCDISLPDVDNHGKCNDSRSSKTIVYTYESFFVSDGRSKCRNFTVSNQKSKFVCSDCGKHYATSSNLSRHKQTHRSLDSHSARKCQICGKTYVSMPALSMHLLTHNLNHRCDLCGKAFSRPWLLQGHLRSHTGERPYGCAHCGKAFADRSNLRAHMQTHSSLKAYRCSRCNKAFALKAYLNKHYESACLKENQCASTFSSADRDKVLSICDKCK